MVRDSCRHRFSGYSISGRHSESCLTRYIQIGPACRLLRNEQGHWQKSLGLLDSRVGRCSAVSDNIVSDTILRR